MQFFMSLLIVNILPDILFAVALPCVDVRQAAASPQQFALIATRSSTPVHLNSLVARNRRIWIAGQTVTSCTATGDCSVSINTAAFVGTYGSPVDISMDAQVEDGQTLFVASDGSVQYAEAGDNCVPDDATSDVWTLSASGSNLSSNTLGSLAPADKNKILLACPPTAATKNIGPWQVYLGPGGAIVPSGNTNDCWAFNTLSSPVTSVAAYEYD